MCTALQDFTKLCYACTSKYEYRIIKLFPTLQSNSACEFVRQHLSSDSYLDPSTGKHHSISDVNYVVSGDFVRASHLHINDQIDGRFLKHFVVVHWDGYRFVQLCVHAWCVYDGSCVCTYLTRVLFRSNE